MNNNSMKIIKEFKKATNKDTSLSKNTSYFYLYDLTCFVKFLNIISNEIQKINSETTKGYYKYLCYNNFSEATINRRISSLRYFFMYLMSKKIIQHNYAYDLPIKKIKSSKNSITLEQYKNILNTIDLNKKTDLKNVLIYHLLIKTRYTIAQIIDLKIEDLPNLNHIDEEITFLLEKYLDQNDNQKYLFEHGKGNKITRQGISKQFKIYAKKANIAENISLHSLKSAQEIFFYKEFEK